MDDLAEKRQALDAAHSKWVIEGPHLRGYDQGVLLRDACDAALALIAAQQVRIEELEAEVEKWEAKAWDRQTRNH